MSGNSYFLDTNIISYYIEGNEEARAFLEESFIYISFITELELLSIPTLPANKLDQVHELLQTFKIFQFSPAIKELTISYKRDFKLKIPDAIIAATASVLQMPLVTADSAFKKAPLPIIYFQP
ncbi:type II toxin-antitoxin system VapC family toxin [Aridibaculum aurantiacum]|uniref:type II toxin-antitoxin system VapC family toxin n=1 Tax=Aridibaculum aurantiacum TaxID=2810307 RepID=UPI001A967045|nr:type II toxin-antitoxin system VapC family toxin [Aridibaculum aurantiacum]